MIEVNVNNFDEYLLSEGFLFETTCANSKHKRHRWNRGRNYRLKNHREWFRPSALLHFADGQREQNKIVRIGVISLCEMKKEESKIGENKWCFQNELLLHEDSNRFTRSFWRIVLDFLRIFSYYETSYIVADTIDPIS